MQVVEFHIEQPTLKLAPIGDIQFGSQGCDVEKLKKHMEWAVENGCHFIGMGDYLDPGSPSNRKSMAAAGFYDSVVEMVDDAMCRLADKLTVILEAPDRWLGLIEGDHGFPLSTGEPIDHYLAEGIDTPFLGTAAFVMVYLKGCPVPLKIWVFHGHVSSSTNPTGLTLEFARKQAAFDADIFLMGHAHQLYTVRRDVLTPARVRSGWKIKHRTVMYAATGSFLNGWQMGTISPQGYPQGGYVELGGLTPVPTGAPIIEVVPEKREEGWHFHMRASS